MKTLVTLLLSLVFASNTAFAVIKVNGAGASFPFPIYSKWFAEYEKTNKDVQFNYQAIGSSGGIRQLIKQTVDFGASDAPMKTKDEKKAAWPVIHVPTVLGAVSVAYNVKEIAADLKLDGETLANIFLGNIAKWNDKRIAALNPGVTLPNIDILVVRRADGSGTTAIFSDYLTTISKEWKTKVGKGKSLKWPTGIGAKGNDGVTGMVKQTNGAIGYVELAYALKNKLKTLALKNQSGKFVKPSIEGISASASEIDIKNFPSGLKVSIVNAPGAKAYPISAFTYILFPVVKKESTQLKEVRKFLSWALSEGQAYAPTLHYAPLPKKLVKLLKTEMKL